MSGALQAIYQAAFDIWNNFIAFALTLFNTSPLEASEGSLVAIIQPVYTILLDIGLTIALIFFIIAVIKETYSAPPGQQVQKMFLSSIRYGVILFILANLWNIMGIIIKITDGITRSASTSESTLLTLSDTAKNLINDYFSHPPDFYSMPFGQFIAQYTSFIVMGIIFFVLAIVTLFIVVASAISILSSAFQRIVKPLVIMPFSAIMVAAGAGTGDSERSMWNYFKTFIGFCLSGAVMVVCIRIGTALCNGIPVIGSSLLASLSPTDSGYYMLSMIFITLQMAITPIVVAGLIKGVDGIISRFL